MHRPTHTRTCCCTANRQALKHACAVATLCAPMSRATRRSAWLRCAAAACAGSGSGAVLVCSVVWGSAGMKCRHFGMTTHPARMPTLVCGGWRSDCAARLPFLCTWRTHSFVQTIGPCSRQHRAPVYARTRPPPTFAPLVTLCHARSIARVSPRAPLPSISSTMPMRAPAWIGKSQQCSFVMLVVNGIIIPPPASAPRSPCARLRVGVSNVSGAGQ